MADCLQGKILPRGACLNGRSGMPQDARCSANNDYLQSALSGLDIALWDIKGKKLGVPVWQLLGGKVRDRVRVYGWVGGDSPSEVVSAAKVRLDQGFTAVKMNGTGSLFFLSVSFMHESNEICRCYSVDRLSQHIGGCSYACQRRSGTGVGCRC